MSLSLIGMVIAAAGYLPPVAGAIVQEVIDVLAVVNALRWRSRRGRSRTTRARRFPLEVEKSHERMQSERAGAGR